MYSTSCLYFRTILKGQFCSTFVNLESYVLLAAAITGQPQSPILALQHIEYEWVSYAKRGQPGCEYSFRIFQFVLIRFCDTYAW